MHAWSHKPLLSHIRKSTKFKITIVIMASLFVMSSNAVAAVFTNLCPLVEPNAGVITSHNILYGTSSHGNGDGLVFAIHTDGTCFTNLHSFNGNDGETLFAGLVMSSNTLYGTTRDGGSNNNGVIFAVNTDGTDFTNLHLFNGNDGSFVVGG